jgi:hypothetical protein
VPEIIFRRECRRIEPRYIVVAFIMNVPLDVASPELRLRIPKGLATNVLPRWWTSAAHKYFSDCYERSDVR